MPISEKLKRATVLIDKGPNEPLGTGYLVGEKIIATCDHVVPDLRKDEEVTCWFRAAQQEINATKLRWSKSCDAALLELKEFPKDVEVLSLKPSSPEFLVEWESYAFPAFAKQRGIVLEGQVQDLDDFDTEGRPALQLFSQNFLGEMPDPDGLGGISGSPVMSNGRIIGHIFRVLGAKGAGQIANLGCCFAVPAAVVRALLERTERGCIENACAIVPQRHSAEAAAAAAARAARLAATFEKIRTNAIDPAAVKDELQRVREEGVNVGKATLFAAEQFIANRLATEAIELLKDQEGERASQLRALSYSLEGNHSEAQAILRRLTPTCETGGIEGGMYKRRWLATQNDAWLEASYNAYKSAYDYNREDSESYYPGVNLAAVALYRNLSEESRKVAQEVVDSLSASDKTTWQHWHWASLAEAQLLLGKFDDAETNYRTAVAKAGLRDVAVMHQQAMLDAKYLGQAPHILDAVFSLAAGKGTA
jgi:hypothetical protein